MKYVLKEKEAIFLKKKFNFSKLIGLNEAKEIEESNVLSDLQEKGIIYTFNGDIELQAEYRLLFSQWEKMRYSVVRPEINNEQLFQSLLCGDNSILFVQRKDEVFEIELYDFSERLIVECIKAIVQIQEFNQEVEPFLLIVTPQELEDLLKDVEEKKLLEWQNKTGIDKREISRYKQAISSKDARLVLVEDFVNDAGFFAKIVVENDGIYVLKHVNKAGNDKLVLLKGNADFVTDSIFNF